LRLFKPICSPRPYIGGFISFAKDYIYPHTNLGNVTTDVVMDVVTGVAADVVMDVVTGVAADVVMGVYIRYKS